MCVGGGGGGGGERKLARMIIYHVHKSYKCLLQTHMWQESIIVTMLHCVVTLATA